MQIQTLNEWKRPVSVADEISTNLMFASSDVGPGLKNSIILGWTEPDPIIHTTV